MLLATSSLILQEFNFSGDQEVSISQLVDMICDISNIERTKIVRNGPERPGKDAHYRLDCKKAKDKLNWQPKVSLSEGLLEVSEWISSNISKLSLYSWEYVHRK